LPMRGRSSVLLPTPAERGSGRRGVQGQPSAWTYRPTCPPSRSCPCWTSDLRPECRSRSRVVRESRPCRQRNSVEQRLTLGWSRRPQTPARHDPGFSMANTQGIRRQKRCFGGGDETSTKQEASRRGQATGEALMWDTSGNLGKKMGKFVAGSVCSPLQIPGSCRGALRMPHRRLTRQPRNGNRPPTCVWSCGPLPLLPFPNVDGW
jgi:hypothetical protein